MEWGGVVGGIWLLGIAVLAATGWWWPGIWRIGDASQK